ncbi:MAG: hypothetical protein H0V01_09375 [Bacteroidetes bacterium]|nr:hypothetical protein [Bacteroidota bacterium]HET6243049.1 SiaB family protein kinase [Bacteroidia bacterium]
MKPKVFFAFFKQLEKDSSTFVYQADFNENITENLLRLSEFNINNIPEISKLNNTVSFLMAECFQNIIHHSDKPKIKNRTNNLPEMFLVRNIENTIYISSTNLIENTKIERIKGQLDIVNKLEKAELKELYLEVLTNESYSEKGGAGLGIIEMARKSGHPITFDFEFVNYFLSLFHLQLKLKSKTSPEEKNPLIFPLSHTKEIHDIMYSDNILLAYKGNFSQETILPILGMIEHNLNQTGNIGKMKKVYYVLVELLQNISKHGKKIKENCEGIIIIGIKGNGYFISAGNIVDNKKVSELQKKLDNLKNRSKESLSELYKHNLLDKKPGLKGGAGLGLIDIFRNSNSEIDYDFFSINDESSFFSLNITL